MGSFRSVLYKNTNCGMMTQGRAIISFLDIHLCWTSVLSSIYIPIYTSQREEILDQLCYTPTIATFHHRHLISPMFTNLILLSYLHPNPVSHIIVIFPLSSPFIACIHLLNNTTTVLETNSYDVVHRIWGLICGSFVVIKNCKS